MSRKSMVWLVVATLSVGAWYWGTVAPAKESNAQSASQAGVPAERVVDMLHAVIQADRTVYTVHVVERLQGKGVVVASENWQTEKTLPLPVQFMEESARLAANTPAKVGYRLLSLWPINKRNAPKSDFEQTGLWETVQHPDRPYTGMVINGGDLYYQAIYADKAVSQACIGCHNAHPDSPRRDHKMNDVMGGLLISIPLQ
jgi:hypothetical protein